MNRRIRIIASAVLLALSPLAIADDVSASPGQSRVATRLSTSFATVAGSPENARALVNGLRNGTEVTLLAAPAGGTGDPVATTFTPPTRPMGWGNVSHSLSLAQDSLVRLGITNPTNEQLQSALLGGDVTAADGSTVTLRGILQMRADGMGWGNIAKASGTTMGAVVSSTKAMQGKAPATATTTTTTTTTATATSTAKVSRGVTTAAGSAPAAGKVSKGITTASGSAPAAGKVSKGITTASGVSSPAASKGVVTAEGSVSTHGRSGGVTNAASGSGGGNAYGRGMVTASGGSAGAGVSVAAAHGRGAGVVSATGASASSNASSITSAGGNGNGHGQGNGNGKGKGG